MRIVFFLGMVLFLTCNALASPDLGNYRDVEGIRIFSDHLKNNQFYLTPSLPVLGTRIDTLPDVSLEIYRYLGRKGTGDSGKFWVKGVLTIGIQREREKALIKQIKKALSKTLAVKNPKLMSIPVTKTKGKLLFADKTIEWSQGSRWSGKRITVPLDSTMSELLWDAVQAGQTLISVEMAESLSGVRKNNDNHWEADEVPFSSTLPVELDMKAFPSLFSRTDIGGRMVRGYTGIDIFCFDFLEHLDETLYSKIVEVAIPTPKKPLVESVTFRKDSDCRTRIDFKLAKDLDIAYKVRITRVFLDGRSEKGPWIMRPGEAMLDITDYKNETDDKSSEE
ncbi:MAG: hypothetical protein KKE44_11835 [Proteobacteria bacterium]|nr:hypothetical protein [Pseudomonadota bacterium]MBU1583415.1 hypothetical protein [Pseudomonadota bacterium]MBU2452766.1 hypothetical protein [Pseudomonadota bacterium]MBU2628593.1 hypothetical protein [Pseudomonadota bacterium]